MNKNGNKFNVSDSVYYLNVISDSCDMPNVEILKLRVSQVFFNSVKLERKVEGEWVPFVTHKSLFSMDELFYTKRECKKNALLKWDRNGLYINMISSIKKDIDRLNREYVDVFSNLLRNKNLLKRIKSL